MKKRIHTTTKLLYLNRITTQPKGREKNKILRYLLISCGFLFTFLAILGALLPILPTTPFLIWTSTLVSVFLFIPCLWLEILVIPINSAITVHLSLVRTKKHM